MQMLLLKSEEVSGWKKNMKEYRENWDILTLLEVLVNQKREWLYMNTQ